MQRVDADRSRRLRTSSIGTQSSLTYCTDILLTLQLESRITWYSEQRKIWKKTTNSTHIESDSATVQKRGKGVRPTSCYGLQSISQVIARRWPNRLELSPYVHKKFRPFRSNFVCMWVDLHRMCVPVWPRPDLRSRSRSRSFQSCENCTFLGLSPLPFWRGAQNWWLILIVWDLIHSLSESDFRISFQESYHESSNFAKCRYFTNLKRPYFGSALCYSHTVGLAGSPARTVYAGVILTRSKVKVKITALLNFRKLPKTAHF